MSKRLERVNQLIKKEVAQIICRETEIFKNVLVTVIKADTSPDLRESKIFISFLPDENKDWLLKILNKKIFFIQQKLNKKLKMKPVPKIIFLEEKGSAYAEKIERILQQLKKKSK